jgi:ribosomal protein L12E/L44/L45/RPP1/RPP2
MVRSIQTTHVNTNYIPPPRRAPVYPVVVEKVHVNLHHLRVENGVILEDSSEEILVTPTPLSESQAFAARASAQAPALGGDDPDDSGDGGEDDDEEEEDNNNEEARH